MALPKEIQDLLDYLEEQEPFEMNNLNLSPHIMVETSLKWLRLALIRSRYNRRLLNFPEKTAKELLELSELFDDLK